MSYTKKIIGNIKLNNGTLQDDTMSLLLFIMCIIKIMNKLDEIIKWVEIRKGLEDGVKNIRINKLVYMYDLKVFINNYENPIEIDNKIIGLYNMIGMKINEGKSGITGHGKIEILAELTEKYPIINKENKYKYLGLHIYEVNENNENENSIIERITKTLDNIEPLDLNNKTIIKCLNTQIMGQIRYYIGSVIFSTHCMERIDLTIMKL